MRPQTTGVHVNPSEETIRLGPLAVRFLVTGEHSTGSVAAFELVVPAAQHLAAPAHSHNHYEETAEVIDRAAGGPPDRAKMAEIMRRHGLTPAPPPTTA